MKSNIDLTEGRDFPDRGFQIPNDIISRTLFKHIGIPWNLKHITSDFDLSFSADDYLFPTGTKHQIMSRRITQNACSGNHCDRCGISLKVIPWSNRFGLCKKCEEDLANQYGRKKSNIPWRDR